MARRRAADPALAFAISVLLSLALWWPSLGDALDGRIDITVAGLRYFAALGVSSAAVFGLSVLVAGHSRDSRSGVPPALPPGPVEHPLRSAEPVLDQVVADTADDLHAAAYSRGRLD